MQQAIWAANLIQDKPYVYGGGHAEFEDDGYDCSGTVSYALHGAGLLDSRAGLRQLHVVGREGRRARGSRSTRTRGHAYAVIAGLRLDTSAASVTRSNTRKFKKALERGPRWRPTARSSRGFKVASPARLLVRPTSHPGVTRLVSPKAAEYAWSDSISPTTQGREVPWPGMSGRFSTVIKAKINRMLDKAEDPAETLEYSYQKQMELLQNVKKGIADVVTSKKRLQLQQQKLEQQVVKLDTQARQALAQNREDLARVALERKQFAQGELQGLDTQVQELEAQQQSLVDKEAKLRSKIDQFRTKKEVIKAQYSAAEASVKISEAASGVGEEMADVGMAMQRAVDKTENMRARANAMDELEASGAFDDQLSLTAGQDDIDRQLHELSSASAVDDDLARLRAELGQGPAPQQALGSGDPAQTPAPAPAPPTPSEERPA